MSPPPSYADEPTDEEWAVSTILEISYYFDGTSGGNSPIVDYPESPIGRLYDDPSGELFSIHKKFQTFYEFRFDASPVGLWGDKDLLDYINTFQELRHDLEWANLLKSQEHCAQYLWLRIPAPFRAKLDAKLNESKCERGSQGEPSLTQLETALIEVGQGALERVTNKATGSLATCVNGALSDSTSDGSAAANESSWSADTPWNKDDDDELEGGTGEGPEDEEENSQEPQARRLGFL